MIAAKMAAMGMWPQAFSDVGRVAAAGTTGPTATPFNLADVVIINGGTGGIIMKQAGQPGDQMTLINAVGGAVLCYPGGSGQISGAASVSVGVNHAVTLRCLKPGLWFNMNDATLVGSIPLMEEDVPAT